MQETRANYVIRVGGRGGGEERRMNCGPKEATVRGRIGVTLNGVGLFYVSHIRFLLLRSFSPDEILCG